MQMQCLVKIHSNVHLCLANGGKVSLDSIFLEVTERKGHVGPQVHASQTDRLLTLGQGDQIQPVHTFLLLPETELGREMKKDRRGDACLQRFQFQSNTVRLH